MRLEDYWDPFETVKKTAENPKIYSPTNLNQNNEKKENINKTRKTVIDFLKKILKIL